MFCRFPTLLSVLHSSTNRFAPRFCPAMLHTTNSNPLVTCAVVSRHIEKTEVDLPVLRKGLRRLHREIDALATEVGCVGCLEALITFAFGVNAVASFSWVFCYHRRTNAHATTERGNTSGCDVELPSHFLTVPDAAWRSFFNLHAAAGQAPAHGQRCGPRACWCAAGERDGEEC